MKSPMLNSVADGVGCPAQSPAFKKLPSKSEMVRMQRNSFTKSLLCSSVPRHSASLAMSLDTLLGLSRFLL